LGFVVECKAVPEWNACVDIYVPTLNLAIQVDGEHHSKPAQIETDKRFMLKAQHHGVHACRLSCDDHTKYTQSLIRLAVHMCMHHKHGQPCISMYSPRHPVCMQEAAQQGGTLRV
jgi:hypothetical protein